MDSFLTDFRGRVQRHLRRECRDVPVFGYLPDDVAHVPCLVVGRPRAAESGTPAVMSLSLDVAVLGRRVNDDDAQAELDAHTDAAFDALGATRGVKVEDWGLRVDGIEPGSVLVAGLDYPAYLLTVSTDVMSC